MRALTFFVACALSLVMVFACGTSSKTGNPTSPNLNEEDSESAAVDVLDVLTNMLAAGSRSHQNNTEALTSALIPKPDLYLVSAKVRCAPKTVCSGGGGKIQVLRTFDCSENTTDDTEASVTGTELALWTTVQDKIACNSAGTHISIGLSNPKNEGTVVNTSIDKITVNKRTYPRRRINREHTRTSAAKGTRSHTYTSLSNVKREWEASASVVHTNQIDDNPEKEKTIEYTKLKTVNQMLDEEVQSHELASGDLSVNISGKGRITQTLQNVKFLRVGGVMCCIPVSGTIRAVVANGDGSSGSSYTIKFSQPDADTCPKNASIIFDSSSSTITFEELNTSCDLTQ